jgi:tetratricopeptide (TPR) repeat protein
MEKALPRFESALRLDSDNLVAKLNAEYNKQFQEGKRGAVGMFKPVEELFGRYRTWDRAVAEFGPYDEPSMIYGQAYLFLRNRQFRQAAKYFERMRTLFRDDVASRLWLGNLHLMYGQPKEALAIVHEIRSLPNISGIEVTNGADLLSVEAGAYFAKNEPSAAMDVIATQLERHTNNMQVTAAAIKLYSDNGRRTNAYAILEKQLKTRPDDPLLLINKGVLLIGETNYSEAIRIFDHVVSIHTNVPTALLYRAITYIKMGDLNKAKQDYEAIVQTYPNLREALFGLHDIAFEQNQKMAALEYGKRYLSNAIPAVPETKLVVSRVRSLEYEITGKGSRNQKLSLPHPESGDHACHARYHPVDRRRCAGKYDRPLCWGCTNGVRFRSNSSPAPPPVPKVH